MAVVWAFRIAIALAAGGYRVVSAGQPSNGSLIWSLVKSLADGDDWTEMSDAELSALLSELGDTDVNVTTWTDAVDLRKLQIRYSRAPAGGTIEDVAVTTHTFLKAPGGVASSTWTDPTDYAAVESAWNTCWTTLKAYAPPYLRLDQYRWYLDNEALRLPDHAPNPALRITEVDVVATDAGLSLPPQVAVSVTEVTAARKSWGRFYLPLNGDAGIDASGRFSFAVTTSDTIKTFYNACRTAGLIPVVFAPGLPARSSASARRAAALVGPGTVPAADIDARTGVIYEVTHVQVDDLYDIIRSRRWDRPVVRSRFAVT